MSDEAILQLKKLVSERKVKRDSKPRDVKNYTTDINTERKLKAEHGDKVVDKILECLD
jgi:hypothetical protein